MVCLLRWEREIEARSGKAWLPISVDDGGCSRSADGRNTHRACKPSDERGMGRRTIKRDLQRMVMKIVLCENIDWLLSKEAFSIYASCMYHPSYEEYKAQIEDYLHDSSVKVFVCENHGKKTGMMVLKLTEAAAEIIGIAVSDNARRKGIGKQLIQRVMETEHLERIKAQTDEDSIGFYRKCGFSEERIVKEYPDGAVVRYNCALYK